jgi:hypothetical protein
MSGVDEDSLNSVSPWKRGMTRSPRSRGVNSYVLQMFRIVVSRLR